METQKIINLRTVSHNTCDITLRSDHIVRIEFKEIDEFQLDHAVEIFNIIQSFNPKKRHLILISLSNYINPSIQVMEFWAEKERNEISLAEALLLDNFPMTLIANFYLTVNRPHRPSKTFKNETDAVAWLKKHEEAYQNKLKVLKS